MIRILAWLMAKKIFTYNSERTGKLYMNLIGKDTGGDDFIE
jgi:hypothetical protein